MKLFAPLIEMQEDPENRGEHFCYLFHSTVKDFLIVNQRIFQQDPLNLAIHSISEFTIANACLLYLSQDRYSELLKREGEQWIATSKEDIQEHHLLTYSAKYWDKHMDRVEGTAELRQKIEDFLTSSNFGLTIQIQSLFVQGHFENYGQSGGAHNLVFTKRVLPRWFASHSRDGCPQFARNYRSYISEWHTLLNCAGCDEPRCCRHLAVNPVKGELDRCLWGALGPRNFLSCNSGRYTSFMLCDEDNPGQNKVAYHEAISQDGSKVVVLQPSAESAGAADFTFHHQTFDLPKREKPINTSISTSFDDKRWAEGDLKKICFTSDLNFMRIGVQIYLMNDEGEYRAVDGLDITSKHPTACFDDMASRGSLLVVTSRRKMPAIKEPPGREETEDDRQSDKSQVSKSTYPDSNLADDLSATECRQRSREPSISDHASDTSPAKGEDSSERDEDDSDSSDPLEESSEWNSAEESWSEGSTEIDGVGDALSSSDESSSIFSEASVGSDDESQNAVNNYSRLREDSDGEDVEFDCGSDNESYDGDHDSDYGDGDQGEDLHFDSDDEERQVRQMAYARQDRKRHAKTQQGVLTIYDLAACPPNQVFSFTHQLPVMLYDSPPAIHPTKPLVVWALCGGDILFADYEGNSYFIRRARTTTRKSQYCYLSVFHESPDLNKHAY